MNILHIFQSFTGDAASVAIPLTAFFVLLFGIFFFGSIRSAKLSNGVWYKQNKAKFLAVILGLWLAALAWNWSEYRPYNPKKDGVPVIQTDSTRISADSMIKLQKKLNK